VKIAYLNTLGIPAHYRGFETCVEEVSTRLVRRGHEVTVYCASGPTSTPRPASYRGVTLCYVNSSSSKFLDYPTRSLLSTVDAISKDCEILHYYGTDSSVFTILPRALSRKKIVMTLDGFAWSRSSYPRWVQLTLRSSAWVPLYVPHATIVDSIRVGAWYRRTYGKAPKYIPYGAKISPRSANAETLQEYKYILFVGILAREKGVHYLIRAFNELSTNSRLKLVIVGGNPYSSGYESSLREMAHENVKFLGQVYGSDVENLFKGAYLYVSASELEGTSPALLSAMGFGNCVLISDIPENLETVGDAGVTFKNKDVHDLREKMLQLVSNPSTVENYRSRTVERVSRLYSWDKIAERTEHLYLSLTEKQS